MQIIWIFFSMQDMPADMAAKNENTDTKESSTAVSTNNNTNL